MKFDSLLPAHCYLLLRQNSPRISSGVCAATLQGFSVHLVSGIIAKMVAVAETLLMMVSSKGSTAKMGTRGRVAKSE
jgi:hypothetical protein